MPRRLLLCVLPIVPLALVGCPSSDSSSGGATDDSGVDPGDTSAGDTGGSPVDSGGSPTDTGNPPIDTGGGTDSGPTTSGASVLMHHHDLNRDGLYVDAAFTKAAAKGLHREAAFSAKLNGPTYAQPLYVDGGASGKDMLIAATEQNEVTAFDAASGAQLWTQTLGAPVSRSDLPCGNIDTVGVTGTPVIDLASRTLFVDAMTTPDGGTTKKHLVFGLSLDDGKPRAGWPVDVGAKVSGFTSTVQGQRGGLTLLGGTLYVPYGGFYGDCGDYHGWVVAFPLASPSSPTSWHTRARAGGVWAPGGPSSDGTSIFVTTGNTGGTTTWQDGEAALRLGPGAVFSGATKDYFAPTDWKSLDDADIDLGGSGALVVDVPGASPSALIVALGKDGKIYLADRGNLGGISSAITNKRVSSDQIINAAVSYTSSTGTYVVFKGRGIGCPAGQSGNLTAGKISATAPPGVSVAWCADEHGGGSPMVTSDGKSDFIVWGLGAGGDDRVRGFDGDTGATIFAGGGAADAAGSTQRFQTAIVAKGRLFVGSDDGLYAYALK